MANNVRFRLQCTLRARNIFLFTAIFAVLGPALQAAEVGRVGSHVFYSSFWINLHERLRHEALSETKELHSGFSEEEQKVWEDSLRIYRRQVAPKHPVFSSDLVEWQRRIAKTSDQEEPSAIPAEIAAALARAAVVYRKTTWKEDDTANRFWIAVESTLLRETGPEITNDLSKAYGVTWPKLLHIEVVPFADPFGGYTPAAVSGFLLTVISSLDPGYQSFSGVEMLFHEPLHHFDDHLAILLNDAAKKVDKPIPGKLSHAILFYTAGEMTRRALLKRGVVYRTVASEVAQRAWTTYNAAIEKYWQPYLNGKNTQEEAFQQILVALSP